MTKVKRQNFIDQTRGQSLKVNEVLNDSGVMIPLSAKGIRSRTVKAIDVNQDGYIQGKNEFGLLHDVLDMFDIEIQEQDLSTGLYSDDRQIRLDLQNLSASVGNRANNREKDIFTVQRRLKDLGFHIAVDGDWGNNSQAALDRFAQLAFGDDKLTDVTLEKRSELHGKLLQSNPPRVDPNGELIANFRPIERQNAMSLLMNHLKSAPVDENLSVLSASVGINGVNRSADAQKIQQRLADLGFEITVDGDWGNNSQRALTIFANMVFGESNSHATISVTSNSDLHKYLLREDAPKWVEMPLFGEGFTNQDQLADSQDYGSSLSADLVIDIAKLYHRGYMQRQSGAAEIAINDASLLPGGNTPDHASHENGLDLDIRLPTTSGGHGTRTNSANFDFNSAVEMMTLFAQDPRVERIFIGGTKILNHFKNINASWASKIQDGGRVHENHFHVDVKPLDDM